MHIIHADNLWQSRPYCSHNSPVQFVQSETDEARQVSKPVLLEVRSCACSLLVVGCRHFTFITYTLDIHPSGHWRCWSLHLAKHTGAERQHRQHARAHLPVQVNGAAVDEKSSDSDDTIDESDEEVSA